jgi:hypothetical protein
LNILTLIQNVGKHLQDNTGSKKKQLKFLTPRKPQILIINSVSHTVFKLEDVDKYGHATVGGFIYNVKEWGRM